MEGIFRIHERFQEHFFEATCEMAGPTSLPYARCRIGCFVPVRDRQLFLRSCLMQLILQTRSPDVCVILINGPEAARYDRRCVEDLLNASMDIVVVPEKLTTRRASAYAIQRLLEHQVDWFFKIDSDDIYHREYLEVYLQSMEQLQLASPGQPICCNLTHQYWWNAQDNGSATIQKVHFQKGLGLSPKEELRGVKVGAPPTFAFNQPVAELLVAQTDQSPYSIMEADDRAWRTILIDHGIVIQQIKTAKPVFGYLRHSGNTSQLSSKPKS
jgi:hypothetical protein